MSKKLRCIGLDQKLIASLTRHNLITCKDVLNKSPIELMMMLKISIQSATNIIQKASDICKPIHMTALDLYKKLNSKSYLMTSLKPLDDVLNGGLPCSSITEIAGPSGCGKTQFCFMLTVNYLTTFNGCLNNDSNLNVSYEELDKKHSHVKHRNDNFCKIDSLHHEIITKSIDEMYSDSKSVVYIDTEGAFDTERLLQIAASKYGGIYKSEQLLLTLASKVLVFQEKSLESLLDRLDSLEEVIVKHKVGLIVLDSVASLIRKEFNSSLHKNIFERNKLLMRQASLLKYLASSYNIPVIITNQITTQFKNSDEINILQDHIIENDNEDKDDEDNEFDDKFSNSSLKPTTTKIYNNNNATVIALGTHWTHCINSRIVLQYTDSPNLRQLCIVKSPQAPPLKLYYTIKSSGLEVEGSPQFDYYVGSNVQTKCGLHVIRYVP